MSHLFAPLALRELTFRNRIWVSPMCQYSSVDGMPSMWHTVHLGSRAVGGAGLVMVEATAVSAEGRISPADSGIWSGAHVEAFKPITAFIKQMGAVPAIQLAHAGRKAATDLPWRGGKPLAAAQGGWPIVGASAIPFDKEYQTPRQMTIDDIQRLTEQFAEGARRALATGFEVVEIHNAHGYLLHTFLSPLSNERTDGFGGSLENRMRLPLQIAQTVRENWPAKWPVFVRISAIDWAEGGWDIEQSVIFSRALKNLGIDLIDCSSGGTVPHAKVQIGPGYQVPFAARIRQDAGIATAAVGLITTPQQAEEILTTGKADAVFLARALLRDPYWPLHAAKTLGVDIPWPMQYGRAKD